uniref:Serine/threonine-protein kinase TOR n=1 Tax=Chlamydomonas euryale TaxID=1486919 RepID=A0A7R9YR22_9CHLO|mmetsp:Transcript_15475/g.45655  ORF Transcript_15475/g.45655 Transcript_15475/m.45655 type:complete len:2605 (+) Transcript_15475:282-8096(+)
MPDRLAAAAREGGGGGKAASDTLSRHLEDLCRSGALDRRKDGERYLLEYVEAEARDLSSEAFARFMHEVYMRIGLMLNKQNDVYRRLGGVIAIDELIDVKTAGDDTTKTSRLALLLHRVLEDVDEPMLMEIAARTLGRLVKSGAALTSEIVDREVRRAVAWLDPRVEPSEMRRLSAVLLLREMAEQSPAVFNVHVKTFIDAVWFPLRDAKLAIREAAVQSLKACLVLVEKRETRYRVQWYYKLFEQTMRGLGRDHRTGVMPNAEAIHGSLLVLGELLQHTGEFLLARYKEVVETVLRFKDSKEKQIRRVVIVLLPRLAAFSPERFASEYLSKSLSHLISVLKHQPERGSAFAAIAEMAGALSHVGCQSVFEGCMHAIMLQIRDSIGLSKSKVRVGCLEALMCVGALAKALKKSWEPCVTQLLEGMMLTGLSETLVRALQDVTDALPGNRELLRDVRMQLLDLLSLAIAKRPFNASTTQSKFQALSAALASGELQGGALVRLSLQSLATFDWGEMNLLEFMRDHIMGYIGDNDKEIRQAAVLACCKILERHANLARSSRAAHFSFGAANNVRQTKVVEKVSQRLLVAAVADPSERVRTSVLRALHGTTALDDYMAQADCLRSLFVALNEESCVVRSLAIRLVGRLADRNPAYVSPALRRHLLQLLNDMEHSPDTKHKEDAAFLLECLIGAAPKLILPYVSPIQKALVARLRDVLSAGAGPAINQAVNQVIKDIKEDRKPAERKPKEGPGGSDNGVARAVMSTLGQLATVAQSQFRPYVSEVTPLVIEALQDASSSSTRLVAVRTLGQIVKSTGTVMTPYLEFPQLLSLLLKMLHGGTPSTRHEIMKVLGVVGALDPHTHKINQASLSGEGKLEKEGVRPMRLNNNLGGVAVVQGTARGVGAAFGLDDTGGTGGLPPPTGRPHGRGTGDDGVGDLFPTSGLMSSSDEYFPTVAINALVRLLRDPALTSQHSAVIEALMSIFRALSLQSVPYLPKVLPILFATMAETDLTLREEIFTQVTRLVSVVKQHMRRFLPDLLQLIHTYWASSTRICLQLLAELSISLRDDFRGHVSELLPKFMSLLADAERTCSYDMVRPSLICLEALGGAVEDYLHLLLPSIVRLVTSGQSSMPLEVRRTALLAARRLMPRMTLSGHASAVLHPLTKVLDGPHDELRRDALDALCTMAVVLGQDFAMFVPTIRKVVQRHRISHDWFERLCVCGVCGTEPMCMSDAEDWESHSSWATELDQWATELAAGAPVGAADPAAGVPGKLPVNAPALRRAWESSQRVTKEDWAEWQRNFSVELLRQSASPALRACCELAQVHVSMARELFAAGFVSCWAELDGHLQEQLVRSLEAALASPTIPPETVTALLNLAEFMEHDDKRLPLDTRTLGALAEKCHAFAKALHYKELEFQTSPQTAVEALIHINNQLRQPEAAVGILTFAQKHLHMDLKESWYEKLCRWDEALDAYSRRLEEDAHAPTCARMLPHERHSALLGQMRCLASLAEWERLSEMCRQEWRKSEPHMRREMGMLAAHAAWHMGHWDAMTTYVDTVDSSEIGMAASQTAAGAFLRAVLCVRDSSFDAALSHLERARDLMGTEFAALVGESYERAYSDMVRVQQLAELEEVVAYKRAMLARRSDGAAATQRIHSIKQLWRDRLKGVQRNVEVWHSLFSVRQLVVPMHDDVDNWLKFASLCRKSGRVRQAERMLLQLLGYNPLDVEPGKPGYTGAAQPNVMLAYLKHVWITGHRAEARKRLACLVQDLGPAGSGSARAHRPAPPSSPPADGSSCAEGGDGASSGGLEVPNDGGRQANGASHPPGVQLSGDPSWIDRPRASLHARAFLRLGLWQWSMNEALDPQTVTDVLASLRRATSHASSWAKSWHQWALFNVAVMQHYVSALDPDAAILHVAPAVHGFFRSVALGQAAGDRTGNLQDILRLLTLWFNHGSYPDVEAALEEGFQLVSIDTWLVVIPQIIARIHTNNNIVRKLIHQLLIKIGRHHPQALMYPLLVATKSQSPGRRAAAFKVLDEIRTNNAALVEQAHLVSHELIRMAILWHEMWHEGLEEASRLYFGESNVEGMLNTLLPLHEMMEKSGPTTLKEIAFMQAYGRELSEAYDWLEKYKASRKEAELHQAWDLYYHVFKRINKQLHSLTTLELQYVAPALVRAQGMELAVPGTYIAGEPLVTISAFAPQLQVISSKQRPRKLTICGSDGAEYMFLLKGHEDLRQDERVMQLFGLVNTMLANDRTTAERDLSIARYAVIPLSPNSGLIGWVPNCDTLHALIREYREARKIPLNWEHRLMLGLAPDYDHLMVIQKVEVFEHALESTSGEDLHKVLWLKSRNSEIWLERRTSYTRSAAVMSMVGYILGLGDRHPSNLMLDRYSGKLLHIDFGDCFEASMNREKFPERVPFRLTRMMVKAMEVSGIEGNFRTTCENVMRVLRSNKESVTAMLEAFVHDPLINWRLLNNAEAAAEAPATSIVRSELDGGSSSGTQMGETLAPAAGSSNGGGGDASMPQPPQRQAREKELRELRDAYNQLGDANEVLNSRAVEVMRRMSDKLMGRDYAVDSGAGPAESDSVAAQVQRLVTQAISHENLCQSYIGWCPFW